MPSRVLICLIALAACASCRSFELPPLAEDPSLEGIRAATPMNASIFLAPIEFACTAPSPEGIEKPDLDARAREMLVFSNLFRSVESDGAFADFELKMKVDVMRVSFRRNGAFPVNLLLWALVILPSWWVADETFKADVEISAQVMSLKSGKVVERFGARGETKLDLDDFERGWVPLGILFAPSIFSGRNWRLAGEKVIPPAARKALASVAGRLGGDFRRKFERGALGGSD